MPGSTAPVVQLQQINTRFGSHVVHEGLDLSVRQGEILGIAGGSGSGKSVLLREMIGLQVPTAGTVTLLGQQLDRHDTPALQALRLRCGMLFQHGGLFSDLSVRDNVGLPLHEHSGLDAASIAGLADWRLALTGLPPEAGAKRPAELSGGMLQRAGLARALVLDPELLLLDEPTSGLDPASAAGVNALILRTHALYGLSIVMVTHDLDQLWQVCDRVAVLGEGRVLAIAPMAELANHDHPIVRSYFVEPPPDPVREQARRSHTPAPASASTP